MKAKQVDLFFQSLVDTGVVPGISILTGRNGDILFKKEVGFKSVLPHREPLDSHTLYDLASLTKPLVTGFLTVYLQEKKYLTLEDSVKTFFPQFPFDITILQLLTHTSGLPPWFPFFLFGNTPDSYRDCFFSRINLETKPGKKVNYSCPGYILLRLIIEKVSGVSYRTLAKNVIFAPLGLTDTHLSTVPEHLLARTAPTENGNRFERKMAENWIDKHRENYRDRLNQYAWRETIIRGETHDLNSHHLGGTAGNSGLFASAEDVYRLSMEFFPSSASILRPESLKPFWTNYTDFPRNPNHRSVGFKLNSSTLTAAGKALSPHAAGHTGFTGTSVWLDPQDETVFVILANRVHPEFKPINFEKVRRKIHRVLAGEIRRVA
ncbi:MAG: serine hydrolase domain-containing protein [Candidatus Omnitrophota bacterium]